MADQTSTQSSIGKVSVTMLEETSNLAENLAQSAPFLRFKTAGEKLKADVQAQRLLAQLSDIQQKVRSRQYSGSVSESDLKRLRELQQAVSENENIQEYELAQGYAVALLREVNQEISRLVSIDFASLTRHSGGCG